MSTPASAMEPYMTAREVAAFIRKSESWVYHEAAADRIPGAVRFGGSLRFQPAVVRAWDGKPVPPTRGGVLPLRPRGRE